MSTESAPASPKKILVVDDNEIILKTISLKLQGAGYQVITALDGSEAVAAARKETPDLILLDISFPPDVERRAVGRFSHHGMVSSAGCGEENSHHHHHRRWKI